MKVPFPRVFVALLLGATLSFSPAHAGGETQPANRSYVLGACRWALTGAARLQNEAKSVQDSVQYFRSFIQTSLLEIEQDRESITKLRTTEDFLAQIQHRSLHYQEIHFLYAQIANAEVFIRIFDGKGGKGGPAAQEKFHLDSSSLQLEYIVGALTELYAKNSSDLDTVEQDELYVERIAAESIALRLMTAIHDRLRNIGMTDSEIRQLIDMELKPLEGGKGELPAIYRRLFETYESDLIEVPQPPRTRARRR